MIFNMDYGGIHLDGVIMESGRPPTESEYREIIQSMKTRLNSQEPARAVPLSEVDLQEFVNETKQQLLKKQDMQTTIQILSGKLASEQDAAAKIREELAKKLREGKPIEVGSDGNVTDKDGQAKLQTQPGKLASEQDAAAKIREELAKKLREGKPIEVGSDGNVTDKDGQAKLQTQPGKLAYGQWYETDPQRLRDEIDVMNQMFPGFKLYKKNDGRYYWHGKLRIGVIPNGWEWEIAAIYNNDHPNQIMGGSVRVVLLNPDIQTVINSLGWRPHHLLYDPNDGTYLCTTRAQDIHVGPYYDYETTAAQTITWAVKWLTALELVMTGDLSKELFNRPDGI